MAGLVPRLALVALLALALSTSRVHADGGNADEAEVNFRLGAEKYQAGDYRSALAYFLASNRLAPNRHVRFNVAKTFERLRQFPEAYRWYRDALVGEEDATVRASIEEALRVIEREVAVIDVRTNPAGATVYLDRRDLGGVATTPARIAVAPGRFRVIVHLDGYEDVETEALELARGAAVPLELALARIVGHVDVTASTGTEVRVDDEAADVACIAPCRVDLAPGTHVIHLRKPGFRAVTRQVQVAAGRSVALHVDSAPLTGSVVVTADEPGALVEVDGTSVGFTPVVVPNVAVGARRVRVSMSGFESIERVVDVAEDRQAEVRDVVLQPTREVTTASRVAQSVDDAPASVSVVSAQELAAFRYPTMAEALRGQRGVALSYDGAYSTIAIRGLGQPGDYGNRVLVLGDGATLNDNILQQSYIGYDGRVDLGDVDRIELVRGPGSVLYGTGAVTGVVNLIPRSIPNRTSGEARVSTVDTRTLRGRGAVSVPLGEHGGISLSASGAHSGGQTVRLGDFKDGTPPDTIDGVNRFDAGTANARLEYRALTVQAFFTTRNQHVPTGAYGALPGDGRTRVKDTRALFEARFEPRLGRYVQLFTRAYANVYRFEGTYAYEGSSPSTTALYDERYKGTWFGTEARVVITPVESLRLSAGGEVQVDTRASLDGQATEAGPPVPYLQTNEPYRIYAGYALAEWRPLRALSLSAGARVDAWSTFGATVNPRLVAIVRPTPNDILKLMSGRAFRAPSIYQIHYNDGGSSQVASTFNGNKLGPERLWSAELEYTHKFQDGWSALVSGHYQRARNFIDLVNTDPADDTSPVYYANGDAIINTIGGDFEVRREFRAGWMVGANYAYLSSRFASGVGGSRQAPNAPNHFASFRGIAPLGVAGLKLAFRATLEAPRRISADSPDRTSTAVVADLVLSGEVSRFGLEYALGLYNMFDFRYALPVDPSFASRTFPQQGRSLLATLGMRF